MLIATTILDFSNTIDHRAGEKGIYTLLDMHQDVFSGKFCGEGVPDWIVNTGSKDDEMTTMMQLAIMMMMQMHVDSPGLWDLLTK